MSKHVEKTITKWKKWLDVLRVDLHYLLLHQNIFEETQKIIKSNPAIQKPSAFFDLLGQGYAALVLLGIRRQVKIQDTSISLARLLTDISEHPNFLTRNRFVKLYEGSVAHVFAERDFDKFAGSEKDNIDPRLVTKDLELLRETIRSCEDYTDRRLAHNDKREPDAIPTFDDVKKTLEVLEHLVKKYALLLTATNWITLLPTLQYDWKSVLKEKWIR